MRKKVRLKESGKIGTVKDSFVNLLDKKVLVVELENGELKKCLKSDIEYITEKPVDVNIKDEVTISVGYFTSLVVKKAVVASKGDFLIGKLYCYFGALLATEIFKEKADND